MMKILCEREGEKGGERLGDKDKERGRLEREGER